MDTKICTRCKAVKTIASFSRSSREKDGLQDQCKQCNREVSASYRDANKEKEKLRHFKYQEANKARIREYHKEWATKNPGKIRAKSREFYRSHKESEAARMKKWREENPEWHKNYTKKWREENVERRKAYEAKYCKENRSIINAKNNRRRFAKQQALARWADHKKIAAIYAECSKLTEETGVIHHVDHIVPLRSPIVCGLHCEDNLQILTASENSIKNNKLLI